MILPRDTSSRHGSYQVPAPSRGITAAVLREVGNRVFGRASATVYYREKESTWGSLDQIPTAVLIFHADPIQPEGYKLRSLTFRLDLNDTAGGAAACNANDRRRPGKVAICRRPSPMKVKGGETLQSKERKFNINPQIPTPIGNAGIGTFEQAETIQRKGHWTYESHLDGSRSAIWIWNANNANEQNEDVGDLYGGLIVNHAGDDFHVSCTLEGKLVSRPSDMMWTARRWFKFTSKPVIPNDSGLCISPPQKSSSTTGAQLVDIQKVADELDQKMTEMIKKSLATYL